MALLVPERHFDADKLEMIDRPDNDLRLLEEDLKHLRMFNRHFGGLAAIRKHILSFLDKIVEHRPVEILDLATGSADHPIALAKLAGKLGRQIRITAIDSNPQILRVAQHRVGEIPEINLMRMDLRQVGFVDKSFDIVLCSLAIHHFSREDAIQIIRKMHRLCRIGFIVNDLNRSWIAAIGGWLFTHLMTRNPLTLNDTYVSILRSFTAEEMQSMAAEAGVRAFRIETQPMFRLIFIGEHVSE
jgi:ubiquinone/menaquinone biosynthesis C-methylase UbiE